MSRAQQELRVTPSVLDRLLDYEPNASREPVATRTKGLRQLKDSLRRDLEWLLNTRRLVDDGVADMPEIGSSVLTYGLPDFSHISLRSPSDQARMRRVLERTLEVFEPRLDAVAVTLEPVTRGDRVLRFRIDARIRVEPAPEPVSFDMMLQLDRGDYVVRSA